MNKLLVMAITSLLLTLGFSGQSMARIDISVNFPPPPPFVFPTPPQLIVIPGTYVYYSPDVDFDIFFHAGYWYRPYEGHWYRSLSYEGPWLYIGSPPPILFNLPPNYRILTRGYTPIPYWRFHNNWRAWQKDRFWHRHNWNNYWRRHHAVTPYRDRQHWGRTHRDRHYGAAPSYRERGHWGSHRDRHYGAAPSYRERQHWGRTNPQREHQQWGRTNPQREHGLAPSYRGGHTGQGGGAIHQRKDGRSGAARENQGTGGRHQNRGEAKHEKHEKR